VSELKSDEPGSGIAVSYPEKTHSVTAISNPILAKGNLPYVETGFKITEEIWAVLMSNSMHQNVKKGVPEFQKVWSV
jgi:hypothetical protein